MRGSLPVTTLSIIEAIFLAANSLEPLGILFKILDDGTVSGTSKVMALPFSGVGVADPGEA